jgi:HAD superfamily hydrolase (TIGR01549 family)
VVLDSNTLKIEAMEIALSTIIHDPLVINLCVEYFRLNFGRSRFHHVDVFIEKYLLLNEFEIESTKKAILDAYSSQCKELYLTADITPGFIDFISQLKGRKYIASGSEQEELREVFRARDLDKYFNNIFGSPILKSELVKNILQLEGTDHIVMFGDAVSDFEAAAESKITFIGYLAYSNVRDAMIERCNNSNSRTIESWSEI